MIKRYGSEEDTYKVRRLDALRNKSTMWFNFYIYVFIYMLGIFIFSGQYITANNNVKEYIADPFLERAKPLAQRERRREPDLRGERSRKEQVSVGGAARGDAARGNARAFGRSEDNIHTVKATHAEHVPMLSMGWQMIKDAGAAVKGITLSAAQAGNKTSVNMVTMIFRLIPNFMLLLTVGWWLAPMVGLITILVSAIIIQIKTMIFLLFGQINNSTRSEAKQHFRENRMGLTLMSFIMIYFSSITSLTTKTSQGLLAVLIIALAFVKCCI